MPKKKRSTRATAHYRLHKPRARAFIEERIAVLNLHYGFSYGRIAVRNTRSRWGSCSLKKNLNFSYRLLFLPPELADYVIVHELCHLAEFNHSPRFWALVAETIPNWRNHRTLLKEWGRR